MKPPKITRRYVFHIFCVVILVQVVIITIYFMLTDQKKPLLKKIGFLSRQYAVYTKGCRIPYLEYEIEDIAKLIDAVSQFNCTDKNSLIESNLTTVFINLHALKDYGIANVSEINCFYEPFWRVLPAKNQVDNNVKFRLPVHFNISTNITDEFVRVTCEKNGTIWKDFHSFAPIKETEILEKEEEDDRLNVIISGIDSLSRTHFHSKMPSVAQLMERLEAVEFMGYNRLDYTSFGNIVPLFSGLNSEEITTSCCLTNESRYDNCSFIWSKFKDIGFYTVYAEERSNWSFFKSRGWNEQPTEYYWNTFDQIALNETGHFYPHQYYPLCMGSRPMFEVLLRSMDKVYMKMLKENKKFFIFYWQTSLTHDRDHTAYLADDSYVKHFRFLEYSGILNRSLLIFLSDHGYRYDEFGQTKRFDNRLPFLYMVFPKWYKKKYKAAYRSVQLNAYRLVTTFDIFSTLNHLLKPENLTDENIWLADVANTRGISLFYPIPTSRTCATAGIPTHYCACHEWIPVNKTGKKIKAVANFIVFYLNALMVNEKKCAVLVVDEIVSADLISYGDTYRYGSNTLRDYMVSFKAQPSGAVFDATVRCSFCRGSDFQLTGPVGRLNRYENQSYCTNDRALKMYCYCIDI